MPGTNGLQLGKMIRQKQPDAIIIFLSSSDDFFPQAFDIYAFQYQLKPVKRHKLFEIMDKALSFFSTRKRRAPYAYPLTRFFMRSFSAEPSCFT